MHVSFKKEQGKRSFQMLEDSIAWFWSFYDYYFSMAVKILLSS